MRASATTPRVLRAFDAYNETRPISQRIRPYNFYISAIADPLGLPEGIHADRFHLAAPWSDDPETWLGLPWFDIYSGRRYSVTVVDDFGTSGSVLLRTYRGVLEQYIRHREAKSLDRTGRPGSRDGVLVRRLVRAGTTHYIGKESNLIEEVGMGLWDKLDQVVTAYGQALDPWRHFVVPVLQEMPVPLVVEKSGLSRRTIQRLRNGHMRPHRHNEVLLTRIAGRWAKDQLIARGIPTPRLDVIACRAWLEQQPDELP